MSGYYNIGREGLLARTIPAEAGIFVIGVNDGYDFDPTHTDFNIFEPFLLMPEAELQNATFTDGFLKGDNITWTEVGAGVEDRSLMLQGVVIYFKLGDEGALLAFIDSAQAGLPQIATGVNITAKWSPLGILRK